MNNNLVNSNQSKHMQNSNTDLTANRPVPTLAQLEDAVKNIFAKLYTKGDPFTSYSIFLGLRNEVPYNRFEWRHEDYPGFPIPGIRTYFWDTLVPSLDQSIVPFREEQRLWGRDGVDDVNGNSARTIVPIKIGVRNPNMGGTLKPPSQQTTFPTNQSPQVIQTLTPQLLGDGTGQFKVQLAPTEITGLTVKGKTPVTNIPMFTFPKSTDDTVIGLDDE